MAVGLGWLDEEQWWDGRGPVMRAISLAGTGVGNRREYNETGVRARWQRSQWGSKAAAGRA